MLAFCKMHNTHVLSDFNYLHVLVNMATLMQCRMFDRLKSPFSYNFFIPVAVNDGNLLTVLCNDSSLKDRKKHVDSQI